jgi:hypothetical protein
MAFTPKALADGQVAASSTAIFTATAGVATYIKSLTLYNTDAVVQTVRLYLNRTGSARSWRRFVLAQHESVDVMSGAESILLESGDIILAETTTAAVVDYTLSGIEET